MVQAGVARGYNGTGWPSQRIQWYRLAWPEDTMVQAGLARGYNGTGWRGQRIQWYRLA